MEDALKMAEKAGRSWATFRQEPLLYTAIGSSRAVTTHARQAKMRLDMPRSWQFVRLRKSWAHGDCSIAILRHTRALPDVCGRDHPSASTTCSFSERTTLNPAWRDPLQMYLISRPITVSKSLAVYCKSDAATCSVTFLRKDERISHSTRPIKRLFVRFNVIESLSFICMTPKHKKRLLRNT